LNSELNLNPIYGHPHTKRVVQFTLTQGLERIQSYALIKLNCLLPAWKLIHASTKSRSGKVTKCYHVNYANSMFCKRCNLYL